MITQILQRISFIMSSVLFGIMAYLQIGSKGGAFVYESVGAFRDHYNLMPSAQQLNYLQLLQYDNCFVFFFGLFLLAYAFFLRDQRALALQQKQIVEGLAAQANAAAPAGRTPAWVYILVVAAIAYMIADWTENQFLLCAIRDHDFESGLFKPLQLLKWVLSAGMLVVAVAIDILMRRLLRRQQWFLKPLLYLLISIVIIVVIRFLLQVVL